MMAHKLQKCESKNWIMRCDDALLARPPAEISNAKKMKMCGDQS